MEKSREELMAGVNKFFDQSENVLIVKEFDLLIEKEKISLFRKVFAELFETFDAQRLILSEFQAEFFALKKEEINPKEEQVKEEVNESLIKENKALSLEKEELAKELQEQKTVFSKLFEELGYSIKMVEEIKEKKYYQKVDWVDLMGQINKMKKEVEELI